MIVWGGLALDSGASEPLKTNTGGSYDPSIGDAWFATSTTSAPTGRASHTAVWADTRMIVWGGVGLITATDILQHRRAIRPGGQHLERNFHR